MNSKIFTPRVLFITIAIVVAALSRLLPHPFNFTPIGAIALFGGACFSDKRLAFALPMLSMILSDLLLQWIAGIGWHNTLVYVYVAFLLITCIGIYIRKNAKTGSIILASLASSLLFFFMTNGGVWAASGFEFGINGLLSTLLAGIPFYSNDLFGSFFLNTIMGDLFFNGILFGALYSASIQFPALAKA